MTDKKENKKPNENEVFNQQEEENEVFEEIIQEEKKSQKKEKKPKEKTELEKLTDEKSAYLEIAQRTMAEFDNYKKRNATLRTDSINEGIREAVVSLLPVVDNLERALGAEGDNEQVKSIKEGVEMIFSQMLGVMEGLGLEEIESLGKVFDPNIHHAVMQDEATDDFPSDTVMEVFQKGYTLRGRIIRHAMVKVAK